MSTSPVLSNIILAAVIVMGLANFFAQFVPGIEYSPDPTITLLFAGVAGLILGVKRKGS